MNKLRPFSILVYILANAIGVLALALPFIAPALQTSQTQGAPLFLALMIALCFIALLLEAQGGAATAKFMALLGVLVAINSVLRFIEVAIPGPGGFSPIFFLIILTGYIYGTQFGFLMGALTLLISALTTGGIGPWLPAQMLTASWVGLSAGAVRALTSRLSLSERCEIGTLAVLGALWGFLYGIIINLWFWPFAVGPAALSVDADASIWPLIQRFGAYYLATSFVWDLARALGNAIMMAAFGRPTLRALRRFRRRFAFTYTATPESVEPATQRL
ncbi:MAG: ECF transporter S component [Anaerolineae bacterium]|nr:ECF transporter S component [Anaerolineae bacterium]